MIGSFFYNLLITPIYNILEFLYVFFSNVSSKGLAVIALSFAVTLFCLPLYIVAEKWQETERETQKSMKSGIKRIKQTFKGDEQYMILNAFYREHHYHPIMALRSSFSLLIQIPFFIAAYSFLSKVESLRGYSFLFIRDMGSQDALFHIGNFPINVLPIAMTIINCVAGEIYSKGHDAKEKIQIYGMALIFLVILYNSPAGLVLYWTMNNVLSLVKNVFYKLKNPKKVFYILCVAVLFCAVVFAFSTKKKIYIAGSLALFAVVAAFPLISKWYNSFLEKTAVSLDSDKRFRCGLFVFSAILTAAINGLVLPSYIIESSPVNFCYVDNYSSPWAFLFIPFVQSLGLFFVWPLCFYALFSAKTKKTLAIFMTAIAVCSLINCFAFAGNYGALNDDLTFMHEVVFPSTMMNLLSIFACLVALVLIVFLIHKKRNFVVSILAIASLGLSALTIKNVVSIGKNYHKMNHEELTKIEPIYHLSKTNKNVLVIMQDRLISQLLPFVFEESPELKSEYDGFTYYPNAVSMSHYTQLGLPGILGGYDYTPWSINADETKTIQQKHNEAILTMPKLFASKNFNITVSDVTYENYGEEPVEQIYDGIPNFSRHIVGGGYTKLYYEKNGIKPEPVLTRMLNRNMIYLSLFKTSLPFMRPIIYHRSWWMENSGDVKMKEFMDCYVPLVFMDDLTDFSAENNTFTFLENQITHEPQFLQAPDYVPVENVTNYGTSKFSKVKMYHVCTAAIKRWAEFFEYLKENDCYDNTRIIIVSDHGSGVDSGLLPPPTSEIPFAKESVTASILVKDFDSHGEIKIDQTFMTNADTPYLATKGIFDDDEMKNPFTNGKLELSVEEKNHNVHIAYAPMENLRIKYKKAFNVKKDEWFTVHDDITKQENWSRQK